MLYRDHLAQALQERQADFVSFCQVWREEACECARQLLRALSAHSVAEINHAALASGARKGPGALLSAEFENLSTALVPFERRWRSHEESRRWAIEVLRDRVTFAVDGSQFFPGRDISLPTAAVQVAFFENPHSIAGTYRKEARFFVVTPRELLEGYGDAQWTAESIVNFRRFEEETRSLGEFIARHEGWRERGERTPVGFFDGTLLISYAGSRNPLQSKYIEAVVNLVKLSRQAQVPIIGFIDQSYARDIVNFVSSVSTDGGDANAIYDAQMLRVPYDGDEPLIDSWGDRTGFFLCAREGLKDAFSDERGEPLVGFIYLQTMGGGEPARLDIPAWVYDAGLLETVIDTVRAECVVGNGYPYALETADATAVITGLDRDRFLRAMQDFAGRENLDFLVSRKPASKSRRR